MKDDTKHTQLNEAKWDRWAESFDGGGWVHRYLRDAQSKLVSLLDDKLPTTLHVSDLAQSTHHVPDKFYGRGHIN